MKWKKHELLGAGSYGKVYLAAPVDSSIQSASSVAVKSANVDRSSTLEKEATFLKELRGKQNIIQCFGEDVSLEDEQNVYNLLLEYASGGNLLELIRENQGTIPESTVAYYTFMLLRGIAAMHDCHIVHCDLKPGNILVFPAPDGMNELKIADFGIARRVWDWIESPPKYGGSIFCRGTPIYASPESLNHGLHDKASDIWSLGCIVWEMITGKTVCSCRKTGDLILFAMFGKPTKEIPEDLSEDGKDFLRRCLERMPAGRWTAKQLMKHPFIVKNLEELYGKRPSWKSGQLLSDQPPQANPFGDRWISTINLFATSSIEAQWNPFLFQNNKKQESLDPLGICEGLSELNLPDDIDDYSW